MRISSSARVASVVRYMSLGLMLGVQVAYASHGGGLGVFTEESFRLPYVPEPTTLVTDVELGDVDGDGDLDLWVSRGTLNGDGRRSMLWRNNGMGQFTLFSKTGLVGEQVDHTDAVFGDLRGTGHPDVVEAVNLAGERVKFNDGKGSFGPGKGGGINDSSTDVTVAVALFDADGDGDTDVVEANECPPPACTLGGAQNVLWMNNGTGVFTNDTAARLPITLDQTSALVPGDVDGDGDQDLVVVNGSPAGEQSLILVNDGSGHFADETATRLPSQLLSGRDAAVVDVDGDADRDLILLTSRETQTRLYLNNGIGVFSDVTATHLPVLEASFQEIDVVVNGNGVVDFLYLCDTGPIVDGRTHTFEGAQNRLWQNDGAGHFTDITATHLPAVIATTLSAAVGDIDGDGDVDIITAGGRGEPLRVYIQN